MTKDLLSAMYVDLEQKKRRANNIIISDLKGSRGLCGS